MEEICNTGKEDNCSRGSRMPKSHSCEGIGHSHFGMMMGLVKSVKMELIKEKVKRKIRENSW